MKAIAMRNVQKSYPKRKHHRNVFLDQSKCSTKELFFFAISSNFYKRRRGKVQNATKANQHLSSSKETQWIHESNSSKQSLIKNYTSTLILNFIRWRRHQLSCIFFNSIYFILYFILAFHVKQPFSLSHTPLL